MMKKLEEYNKKRDFKKTTEPKGKEIKKNKNLRFVVQHHLATKDHYDFRLELDGVLKSFAIPKGPSYNTKDKRLAIQVEDHPYQYRNFEGVIPKGEYGAGPVMIWDEGYWEPLGNPVEDLKKGSMKFILKGRRLQGKWTLVSFKENWLLIKEKDGICLYESIDEYNTSIKTRRTMEEIIAGKIQKREIEITNPDKIMNKRPKITKADIVKYYELVSKRMLTYTKGRILSTVRCPNGIKGTSFFKKHFENKRGLLKKIFLKNERGEKGDYYSLQNEESIKEEVQMNGIEFHIGGCLLSDINKPNMLVFDLDPDEGMDIRKVREGVLDLKEILDELSLTSFLKTSGGKGYHVVVPIHSCKSWKVFKSIARDIALIMESRWPDKYVANMSKSKRKNKIFIDWLRNTKGASSVAPYSLRVRSGCPVSMPIKWSELKLVKPNEITMEDAIKRLKRKDPWEGFFEVNM